MAHADRYQKLRQLANRDNLDSSYEAAFFLLAADEVVAAKSSGYISNNGIDFEGIGIEVKSLDENQIMLVSIARNLFSWTSGCEVTPFDISRLGYPLLDYVCQAFYIAVGHADVVYCAESPVLELDMSRYNKTKKAIKMMYAMERSVGVS